MEASLWSGPVILTLCLSVLALIVSVTALIWQVVSWRRSGPQVRVSSRVGVADTVPFVSIEITNAGRMATEVNQLGFQLSALDDRQHIVMFRDALGMLVALPLALPPGGTVSKMFAAADVLQVIRDSDFSATQARAYTVTGHGRMEGEQFDLRRRVEGLVESSQREG